MAAQEMSSLAEISDALVREPQGLKLRLCCVGPWAGGSSSRKSSGEGPKGGEGSCGSSRAGDGSSGRWKVVTGGPNVPAARPIEIPKILCPKIKSLRGGPLVCP